MIKKICLIITTFSFIGCAGNPTEVMKPYENQRTYDIPGDKIIDMLGKGLPNFLTTTSATPPKIEVKHDETGVALIITNYKPKDDRYTQCFIADGGGLLNRKNGLDHGVIAITLIPGSGGTIVRVLSAFNENHSVTAPGKVIGYVSSPYGGGVVRGTTTVDLGSHCYSTGIIQRSIFDLIQSKGVSQGKSVSDLGEALVLDEEFNVLVDGDGDFKRYASSIKGYNEVQRKNLIKNTMNPQFIFSARNANTLGVMYAKGLIVSKNETAAFKLFEKAATAESIGEPDGTTAARFNLGIMYEKGLGTSKNEAKALEFTQLAGGNDWPRGQTKLGYLYAKGLLGLKKDETKAVKLFTQVVIKHPQEGSYFVALRNLGYMYAQGLGVKKNDVVAYVCYKTIAFQGEAKTQKASDIIRARMTDDQINEANSYLDSHTKFGKYIENSLYL